MEQLGDMRRRIIDAAVRQIESDGEHSLRLRDIAAVVGVAEPTLYHYFANREALISAAHAERYRKSLIGTLDPFIEAVNVCTSKAEFVAIFHAMYSTAFRPERAAVRATRAQIIGSALFRPDLYEQVTKMMRDSLDEGTSSLRVAQANGWLRPDIDVQAFSFWNLAHMSSLIYAEMQNDEQLVSAFKKIALDAVNSVLAD